MRMITTPTIGTIRKLRAARAASIALALCVAACGGEEQAPAPAAAPEPAARAPAPPPPIASDIQVQKRDADGNPTEFAGKDASGNEFVASIGSDASVPEDFPEDVPIYPDAAPMAAMMAGAHGSVVTFKSTGNQQKIYQFYKENLVGQGWQLGTEGSFGGQMRLEATKDSRRVNVMISGTEGDTRIGLSVSENRS